MILQFLGKKLGSVEEMVEGEHLLVQRLGSCRGQAELGLV